MYIWVNITKILLNISVIAKILTNKIINEIFYVFLCMRIFYMFLKSSD